MPEIDRIHGVVELEDLLLKHVIGAGDRAAVEHAIAAAANQQN